MISLAEISSNKYLKRPVIVAFFNYSGVVWTTGPKLPWLLMKSIIRRRSSMISKRKTAEGSTRAKVKCTINKHRKQKNI